jgi:serine O-acetyltransferase
MMFRGMREDVRAVFDRDPAARHWFEVITTSPGLHAIWIHRVSHALWCCGLKWLARFIAQTARFSDRHRDSPLALKLVVDFLLIMGWVL